MSDLFHAEIVSNDCGDKIELIGHGSTLNITAESPWSGDTETGFGRDVTVSLTVDQADALRNAIGQWLEAKHRGGGV